MLLIKNAFVVELDEITNILIEDGKIKKIGEFDTHKDCEIIDAKGLFVMPSFSDSHFHLRNPGQEYKQTYMEANDACVKGGYTDVIALANTNPVVDRAELINEVQENTNQLSLDVYQVSSVTKGLNGKDLVDFDGLVKHTMIFSDDGKNVDDIDVMKEALEKSEELGFIIMDHSEPESEMVIRNIELVKEVGGNLHFCHISKKESIEALTKAKDEGVGITFEVTPHHLFSTDLDYRVNPPIATKEDVKALINAIKAGYVDSIGSDHAPHSDEDKKNGSPGIINIESAYSMVRKVFYENGIDMKTLIKLMSKWPAKLVGKERGIFEGSLADIVIVSDEEYKINKNGFVTRSKNTPFHGMDVRGKVLMTIAKGEIVYDNGELAKESDREKSSLCGA